MRIPCALLAVTLVPLAARADPALPRLAQRLGRPGPAVTVVCVSPDGAMIAAGGADGAVRLYRARDGAEVAAPRPSASPVRALAFVAGGARLAAAFDDGTLWAWDVAAGKSAPQLRMQTGDLTAVAFSPDGRTLATGSTDSSIRVRDARDGAMVRRFHPDPERPQDGGAAGAPRGLAFSPDGRFLVSAHGRGERFVHVWDAAQGRAVARLPDDGADRVVFSPDGATLATGHVGGRWVTLWETATWRIRRQTDFGGANPQPCAFSPDGWRLLTLGGIDVVEWHLPAMASLRLFRGEHVGRVTSAAYLPDGTRLVSGGEDGVVLVWELTPTDGPHEPPDAQARPEQLWAALAAEDGAISYDALWGLAAIPGQAVPYLRNRLQPEPAVREEHVRRLLDGLDADAFTDRERATRELGELGEAAEPFLRQRLAEHPTPEAQQRIELLLAVPAASSLDSEKLRAIRSVEVLERIGTPEARAVLETLSHGAGGLARRAQAALERLRGH